MNVMAYAKAIYGSLCTGIGSLLLAYTDEILTKYELVVISSAVVFAFGVVWGVPNMPSAIKGEDE